MLGLYSESGWIFLFSAPMLHERILLYLPSAAKIPLMMIYFYDTLK